MYLHDGNTKTGPLDKD